MRLDEALADVEAIRSQLALVRVTSCYRCVTTAASGFYAMVAAMLQPILLASEPETLRMAESIENPSCSRTYIISWLAYWSLVALISVSTIAGEMIWRYWFIATRRERLNTRETLAEFLPFVAVGVVIGIMISVELPQHASLLPGIWSIIFGLGIFASLRRLPTGAIWIALHYIIAGCFAIKFSDGQQTLAPWAMAATFGVGQLIAAVVLGTRERQVV